MLCVTYVTDIVSYSNAFFSISSIFLCFQLVLISYFQGDDSMMRIKVPTNNGDEEESGSESEEETSEEEWETDEETDEDEEEEARERRDMLGDIRDVCVIATGAEVAIPKILPPRNRKSTLYQSEKVFEQFDNQAIQVHCKSYH